MRVAMLRDLPRLSLGIGRLSVEPDAPIGKPFS